MWLDFSCVPQAADAQEDRLKAIESIPHYIDASTTFVALCPPITHKELDYMCDYHSWRNRGWCRLEEQVNELKLYTPSDSTEDGATGWKVPRRPLIVHGSDHLTSVDQFDHFYMLGQRSYSVFNGTFARAFCRVLLIQWYTQYLLTSSMVHSGPNPNTHTS